MTSGPHRSQSLQSVQEHRMHMEDVPKELVVAPSLWWVHNLQQLGVDTP
jgi:hypothetical protein